ncbi:LemA family protein [Candidatus Parcubacteria bacterium]|nr:LemA family protein [Candidatus Parcubacteria bacterium]
MQNLIWYIIIVVVVVILWLIGVYNALIRLKNRTDEAWSDIDVQLKRRYNLIPNLVETVKGYAAHEKETLEKVVQARNAAMSAQSGGDAKKLAEAENVLSSTLKSIFALSESYPDLKANQNFLELQRELSDTENKIQASRRFYNGNVRDFNTKLEVFPTNMIAKQLKFEKKEFFEIKEAEEKKNVKVEF